MVRELPRTKSNDRPDDDIGDCPAVSPAGYLCTRNRLHEGNHDAKGINDNSLMNWSDHSTVISKSDREPNREDDNPDR